MDTAKLIDCVRQHPYLYDVKHELYNDRAARAQIWEKIGKIMNESGNTAKIKWKSLRDNYGRFRKELASNKKQVAKRFHRWPWAEKLQFLDKVLTEREKELNNWKKDKKGYSDSLYSIPTSKKPPLNTRTFSPEKMSLDIPSLIKIEIPTEHSTTSKFHEEFTQSPSTAKKRKKVSKPDEIINDIQINYEGCDAVDHLFKSYAQTFKGFTRQNQILAKIELAKLFAEIEVKEMEEKIHIKYSPVHSDSSNINDSYNLDESEIILST